jgi:hypothetical protein
MAPQSPIATSLLAPNSFVRFNMQSGVRSRLFFWWDPSALIRAHEGWAPGGALYRYMHVCKRLLRYWPLRSFVSRVFHLETLLLKQWWASFSFTEFWSPSRASKARHPLRWEICERKLNFVTESPYLSAFYNMVFLREGVIYIMESVKGELVWFLLLFFILYRLSSLIWLPYQFLNSFIRVL